MQYNNPTSPGEYKGSVETTGLHKADSGSLNVKLRLRVTYKLNENSGEWEDLTAANITTLTFQNIVKKNGEANDVGAQILMKALDWSGTPSDFDKTDIEWPDVSFALIEEDYKGKTQYRVVGLRSYDEEPSAQGNDGEGFGNVSDATFLDNQYGSSFRAIRGNIDRNKPAAVVAPAPAPEPVAAGSKDEIPF